VSDRQVYLQTQNGTYTYNIPQSAHHTNIEKGKACSWQSFIENDTKQVATYFQLRTVTQGTVT